MKANPNDKVRINVSLSLFSQHTLLAQRPSLPLPGRTHTQINHIGYCSNLSLYPYQNKVHPKPPPPLLHTCTPYHSLTDHTHSLTHTHIHIHTQSYMHANTHTHMNILAKSLRGWKKQVNFPPSCAFQCRSVACIVPSRALLSGNLSFWGLLSSRSKVSRLSECCKT